MRVPAWEPTRSPRFFKNSMRRTQHVLNSYALFTRKKLPLSGAKTEVALTPTTHTHTHTHTGRVRFRVTARVRVRVRARDRDRVRVRVRVRVYESYGVRE